MNLSSIGDIQPEKKINYLSDLADASKFIQGQLWGDITRPQNLVNHYAGPMSLAALASNTVTPSQDASAFVNQVLNKNEPQLPQFDKAGHDAWKYGAVDALHGASYGTALAPVTAAYDAYQGFASGNPVEAAMGAAGLPGRGLKAAGLAASALMPDDAKAMFLGEKAKGANLGLLAKAKELLSGGAAREHIWDNTGWFQGVDGQWRFEIPDNKSFFMANKNAATLGEAMKHDELYSNYPSAENLAFKWSPDSKAKYNGAFYPHPTYKNGGHIEILTPTDASSVTLHETQHYVDNLEGNPSGADILPVKKNTPGWDVYQENKPIALPALPRETYEAINGPATDGAYNNYLKFVAKENKSREAEAKKFASRETYRRDSGEVLARTTQKRMNMTADERKARAPWLDYDVPEEKQIVRR